MAVTGKVSAQFESAGAGVATISTGKGDAGGVSYGAHQLATKTGTMAKFLASKFGAAYRERFAGLQPGTTAFNDVYKQICKEKPQEFDLNQFLFIATSHYDPQVARLLKNGIDITKRHEAVGECVFSVCVQYGPNTSLIVKALGVGFKGTDAEFIEKVQNYRRDTVKAYFKSSSEKVQKSVADRAVAEKAVLLKLLNSK